MRSFPRTLVRFAILASLAGSPAVHADDPIALAAPKDFDAAVKAIEAATGSPAARLHELPASEARAFAVPPHLANRLLEGSHQTFRKAGFYLFRHERSFGVAGENDQLGLMRTGSFADVVRRVGTTGPGAKPSTEAIATWLERLAKEQPFELREIGSDYVAGRFERTPKDPAAMARRCVEFAPDLVAGRASTLELLTREIETRGTLYLIW